MVTPNTAHVGLPLKVEGQSARSQRNGSKRRATNLSKYAYPMWFYAPAGLLYVVFFAVPTLASFYYSLTRWTLFDAQFIGFENYIRFFSEPQLRQGFINTFIYGVTTSGAKVIIGLALAVLLTTAIVGKGYLRSVVFFPVLVSTIGVGVMATAMLDPFDGVVNGALELVGIDGPGWFTDPGLALLTVAGVDIWKGLGIATLIYIAGLAAIPQEYYEASRIDGAGRWQTFRSITLPLLMPATGTVIILSLIGGLRSFDLIWATTGGGPGFSSDVIASVIYKQYQAGFYGLSTAGNVILFLVVTAIMVPVTMLINRRTVSNEV